MHRSSTCQFYPQKDMPLFLLRSLDSNEIVHKGHKAIATLFSNVYAGFKTFFSQKWPQIAIYRGSFEKTYIRLLGKTLGVS